MNFGIYVLLLTLFIYIGGVGSQQYTCSIAEQCGNPMCGKSDLWWGYWSNLYLPEPAYTDSYDVCPYYYNNNNERQCCNDTLYLIVTERFVDVVVDLERTVTAVKKAATAWQTAQQKWMDEKQQIITNETIDGVTKANVTQLIDNVIAAYSTLTENGVRTWQKCAQAILKYWIGLICFSCSAYWKCFVEVSANTTYIKVDSNTCDSMNFQCGSFFSEISKVDQAIRTAFESYTDLITPPTFINPCSTARHKDCKTFICNILISGQHTDYTVGGIANYTNNNNNNNKRINEDDDEDNNNNYNNYNQQDEDDNYTVKLKAFGLSEQFTKSLDVLHQHIIQISRSTLPHKRFSNIGIYNIRYTLDGGYDVYFIGQQSNLDTSLITSSSASNLENWFYFI